MESIEFSEVMICCLNNLAADGQSFGMMKNEDADPFAAPADARIGIMVLGMHRSGTSAVSRLLSLLGCDLPKSLLGAGPGNDVGHWESHAIWHFNDELLSSGNSTWDDWLEFSPEWFGSAPYEGFVQRGRDLLIDEFGSSSLFVLKDPRNCRLFPFWNDVLRREQIQPKVAIVLRYPGEVALSLAARDHSDPAYAQQLWLRHMLDAEFHSRGLPRVVVSYDQLLDDWHVPAAQMEQNFGLTWPARFPDSDNAIAEFLSNERRHHRISVEDAPMPEWFASVYRILQGWAQFGEDQTDHGKLDEIRREVDRAAPNFVQLASSTINQASQVHALGGEVCAQAEKVAALQVVRDALQAEVHAIIRQASILGQELAQSRQDAENRFVVIEAELQREREETRALRAASVRQLRQIDELNARMAEADSARRLVMGEHQKTARRAQMLDARLSDAHLHGNLLEILRRAASDEIRQREKKIAQLSVKLEGQSKTAASQIKWLSEVLVLITSHSSLWTPIPLQLRRRLIQQLLHRKGLFDAKGYLSRHKDVAEQQVDPLRHYVLHGIAEGRS